MSSIKILLVDDDEVLRCTLGAALSTKGHQVDMAENGKEAESKFSQSTYQLVISDVHMHPGNGLELLRAVKSSHPKMPFILMTGYSEVSEPKEAYALGADGFLPKPFQLKELLSLVENIVKSG